MIVCQPHSTTYRTGRVREVLTEHRLNLDRWRRNHLSHWEIGPGESRALTLSRAWLVANAHEVNRRCPRELLLVCFPNGELQRRTGAG